MIIRMLLYIWKEMKKEKRKKRRIYLQIGHTLIDRH